MQLSIKADIRAAERALGTLAKQVPFAASVAINKTARDVRKVEQAAAKRELDEPRTSTIKGIRYQGSNKRHLVAAVFVVSHIDKFLRYQIHDGTLSPRTSAEALPVNVPLNEYCNIEGRRHGKLRKLEARQDTFRAVIGGLHGLWQRTKKRGLKLLVAYEQRVSYRPRFRFYQHAERTVNRRWRHNFDAAIRQAIRTAR